jgi:hypothetical protein
MTKQEIIKHLGSEVRTGSVKAFDDDFSRLLMEFYNNAKNKIEERNQND